MEEQNKILEGTSISNEKLIQEKEQINKRLEEILDAQFTNDQIVNNMSLVVIPEKEKLLEQIIDKFEEITGTRNIDTWR